VRTHRRAGAVLPLGHLLSNFVNILKIKKQGIKWKN